MLFQMDIKGNYFFSCIINESGTIMDYKVIESKYNLTINFLEYYRLLGLSQKLS